MVLKGVVATHRYKEIPQKLKNAGYSSYRIREQGILSEGTMQAIRENKPVNLRTLDIICQLLHCPIEEIVEILPDDKIP